MSHINRKNDHNHEAFLEGYECGKSSSNEESISREENKRYNALYDLLKTLVAISPIDNKSCSTNCFYSHDKICYCRLFGVLIYGSKRCKNCMEIFLDE